jgi:AcrR family transcriptional regulator
VLAAARDVLAERGAGGLTMRGVAERLGVAPNALYSHVRDKTDLIDALLDQTLASVEASGDGDAHSVLATMMTGTYDVLLTQHDLVPLYLARQGARGHYAVALGATMQTVLLGAGLEPSAAGRAMRALIVMTIGFAAYDAASTGSPAARTAFLRSLDWMLEGILGSTR